MNKILTVHNAEIKTAAVEVKTLTVSGKQVTLAVFRQLQERPLLNRDGTLRGIPWGIVNYHPDKCGDSYCAHWHVVWQDGTDLFRARVNQNAADSRLFCEEFFSESGDACLNFQILRYLRSNGGKPDREALTEYWERLIRSDGLLKRALVGPSPISFKPTMRVDAAAICALWVHLHDEAERKGYGWILTRNDNRYFGKARHDREIENFLNAIKDPAADLWAITYDALNKKCEECSIPLPGRRFQDEIQKEIRDRGAYLKTLATIPSLSHLFIAV